MIRTVWLGFSFLAVIVAAGSFRFAFGDFDAANASVMNRPQGDRAVTKAVVQQDFTNRDQPPTTYLRSTPADVQPNNVDGSSFEPVPQLASATTESNRASQHRRGLFSAGLRRLKFEKQSEEISGAVRTGAMIRPLN